MINRTLFFNVVALISANLLCSGVAAAFPSGFWAVAATVFYVIFCRSVFSLAPASFMLLSPLLFLKATELVSGIAIEFGAYVDELATYGQPTGAFTRLSALYILLFYISVLVIEPFWKANCARSAVFFGLMPKVPGYRFVVAVAVFMILYLLYVGARSGFPIFTGVDRFRFRFETGDYFFNTAFQNIQIVVLTLGLFACDPKKRLRCSLLVVSIFLTIILFSEKFTSLSTLTFLFLIPQGLQRIARTGKLPAAAFGAVPAFIAVLTIPIILVVYGFGSNSDAAFLRLASRMTNQGELWWVADRDHLELFKLETDPIVSDMSTWPSRSAQNSVEVGARFGLYYVMERYAPSEIQYAASSQGTGYVFSLFPYLLMVSGVLGVVLVGMACHVILAFVLSAMAFSMARGNIFSLIVANKIFVIIYSGGFIVGYLWFFFGITTVALFVVYLVVSRLKIPYLSLSYYTTVGFHDSFAGRGSLTRGAR